MKSENTARKRFGWWHIPVFSCAFIALFFVSWEIVEVRFFSELPFEVRKWLYIGRGVFGAVCIGIITGILIRRHERRLAQMRQAMVRNERLAVVGQIAAGFAHEVGNPLASISSVIQLLQREDLPKGQAERLALVIKEIDRIDGIVRRLVDFSRPSPTSVEDVDVAGALDEAVEIARYDPRARSVRFERRYAVGLPPVRAVREYLIQVFLNIIFNAMDAMAEGGVLTLVLRLEDDRLIVEFKDTGVGIEPEKIREIFEPFFTTKSQGRGSGLGLAVSRHLVAQHNGRITLDSRLGEGTRVRVTLPSRDSNGRSAGLRILPERPAGNGSTRDA